MPIAPSPRFRRCCSAASPNIWGDVSMKGSTSRSRPMQTPMGCAPMCWRHCAPSATPPFGIRAAISSAATTGWTASAPRISAHAAVNWPGSRSKPTSSAPMNSWASARRSALPPCSASIWAPARSRQLPTWSTTATPLRAPIIRICGRAMGTVPPTRSSTGVSATKWMVPGRWERSKPTNTVPKHARQPN